MLTVNDKLEIFRKIYCLGITDIKKIFKCTDQQEQAYWEDKYESCRKAFEAYGNFHFLLQLDEHNAKKFLEYVGFKDPQNSTKFIADVELLPEGQ